VFDVAGEFVDCLGELGHGFECAVLAPAGDVGDRLAVDGEAGARADEERDGFLAS